MDNAKWDVLFGDLNNVVIATAATTLAVVVLIVVVALVVVVFVLLYDRWQINNKTARWVVLCTMLFWYIDATRNASAAGRQSVLWRAGRSQPE